MTTHPDKETQNAVALALAELFGETFATTSGSTWNQLCQEDKIVWDEEGRAAGIKESTECKT